MPKDKLAEILEKTDGKKAKIKSFDAVPENTKGTKLPKDLVKSLKEKFPAGKFDKVEVHSGKEATDACKEIGANAFASGNKIFVKSPSLAKDNKLLAHELSHVVQQGAGRMPPAKKGKVMTTK